MLGIIRLSWIFFCNRINSRKNALGLNFINDTVELVDWQYIHIMRGSDTRVITFACSYCFSTDNDHKKLGSKSFNFLFLNQRTLMFFYFDS